MRTAPALASMKPAIMRKVVVLPQPEGPSSTTNSPSATSSDRSSTASTSANFLLMFLRCSAAMVGPRNLSVVIARESGRQVLDRQHLERQVLDRQHLGEFFADVSQM